MFYVQLHKLAHKLVDFAVQTEFILPAVLLDHVKPCSMTETGVKHRQALIS